MKLARPLFGLLPVALAAAPALASSGGEGASTLLWYAINFVILIAVLVMVGRKPIQIFFADRRNEIADELNSASELLREAETRHAELQRKLVDLDSELAGIRARSRERANAERERILADARATAERIKADASSAVDREVVRAREKLRLEASELAIELASARLTSEITEADRARLLDEFIGRIEEPDADQPIGGSQ